jgi:hypothetical protein
LTLYAVLTLLLGRAPGEVPNAHTPGLPSEKAVAARKLIYGVFP